MAVSTLDGTRRVPSRAAAFLASLGAALAALGVRLVSPHKASLANLAHMPMTVAGTGSIDFAAFHLAHGWGWLVTGISLILLEHAIADEER